ncbi:CNH domain-containing protein [Zopfochytrium polystomum]|nr:CNH domain-containing protein [Zopfochytrium polystomum]
MLYFEPLMDQDIIEESRRFDFRWDVFGPFEDLLLLNRRLLQILQDRQLASNYVFRQIGDIFLEVGKDLSLYEYYGENNEISVAELKQEIKRNPKLGAFQDWVRQTYKVQELKDYLTNVIKRLSDYKLNLESVLKQTPENHPDVFLIPKALEVIGDVGQRMNSAAKKTQIKRKMTYLRNRIAPNPMVDLLRLDDSHRDLIYETRMTVRRNQDHNITLFLFDHYLVMAKTNQDLVAEEDEPQENAMKATGYPFQIYKEPLPLDLITVAKSSGLPGGDSIIRQASLMIGNHHQAGPATNPAKLAFTVTIPDMQHSTGPIAYNFIAMNEAARDQWVKKITDQKRARIASFPLIVSDLLEPTALPGGSLVVAATAGGVGHMPNSSPYSSGNGAHSSSPGGVGGLLVTGAVEDLNRVVSAAIVADRLLLATPRGILLGSKNSASMQTSFLSNALSLSDITQIDVMADLDLLIVLADRVLYAFALAAVLSGPQGGQASRPRKIAESVAFFRIGVCDGKRLICVVGPSALRWDIKLVDPIKEKKKSLFSKSKDFEIFKEFVIPTRVTSINFLKSRVVLGCTKGFEMVHLQLVGAAANAPLLDQNDPDLRFVLGRDDLNPIGLFRTVDEDFFLCFQDIGFYVNRNGKRTRANVTIRWRGVPTAFAYLAPYIVAVSPTALEAYHLSSGELVMARLMQSQRCIHVADDAVFVSRMSPEGQVVSRISLKR